MHIKQKREEQSFSTYNLINRLATDGKPMRFLVLGDGDFSFSASLHRQLRDQPQQETDTTEDVHRLRRKYILVATSYDSREEIMSKYVTTAAPHLRSLGAIGSKKRKRRKATKSDTDPDAASSSSSSSSSFSSSNNNIKMSSGIVGVMCLHNVDATHLVDSLAAHSKFSASSLPQVYDRIIWNFPHTGEQRVHLNRNIIRDFMDVVATCLSTNGVVYVTLNWKPPYSLWDINTLFPKDQLEAIGYLKFSNDTWSGYQHQTTLGRSGGASDVQEGIEGARTYMFKLASGKASVETPELLTAEIARRKLAQDRARTKREGAQGTSSKRARMEGTLDSSTPFGIQQFVKRNGGSDGSVASGGSVGTGWHDGDREGETIWATGGW